MDCPTHGARSRARRRRAEIRARWIRELLERTHLNPDYALGVIRGWIGASPDRELRIFMDSFEMKRLVEFTVRDAEDRVMFGAGSVPSDYCERWNGREMTEFRDEEVGYGWPLAAGASAFPESDIPTLLDEVFNFLSLADLRECALVCRLWRECAENSTKVASLVPAAYRAYRPKRPGKGCPDVVVPKMRMAALFAPWELLTSTPSGPRTTSSAVRHAERSRRSGGGLELKGVPNDVDLLGAALVHWFRTLAPTALARATIEIGKLRSLNDRPRAVVKFLHEGTWYAVYEIHARVHKAKVVCVGLSSLEVNHRTCALSRFVEMIASEERVE